MRAISSAGSEHLPYKQGVTGSNPVLPTKKASIFRSFFFVYSKSKIRSSAIPREPLINNVLFFIVGNWLLSDSNVG